MREKFKNDELGDDGELRDRGVFLFPLGENPKLTLALIALLIAITGMCSCSFIFQFAFHGDFNAALCQTFKLCAVIAPSPNPLEWTETAIGVAQTQTAMASFHTPTPPASFTPFATLASTLCSDCIPTTLPSPAPPPSSTPTTIFTNTRRPPTLTFTHIPTVRSPDTPTPIIIIITAKPSPITVITTTPIPNIQTSVPAQLPVAVSTNLPTIGNCENLPPSDNWLIQCSFIPNSGKQITWKLDKGQILYVSGQKFQYQYRNTTCGSDSTVTNVCVFIYEASSPTTITLTNVGYPNWLGVTNTDKFYNIKDALNDREPYFWKTDNCSTGCRTATAFEYLDGNLVQKLTTNNPNP